MSGRVVPKVDGTGFETAQAFVLIDPATGQATSPSNVTLTGPITVSNEVEIKNDTGNPVPMAPNVTRGGGAVDANTQRVTLATDGPGVSALASLDAKTPALVGTLSPVEPLGVPGVARQLTAGAASANTALTATCRRVSMRARSADVRFSIGVGAQTALAATSHYLAQDERLDFAVPANAQIAVIRDSLATVDGTVCLTELA